jgi:hypothetical protein
MDVVPYRVGVPKSRQSGLEKFEGPDPNEWCMRGYAILDPNARGSFDSEGDLYFFGPKDCEYPVVVGFAEMYSKATTVMTLSKQSLNTTGVMGQWGWLATLGLEFHSILRQWHNPLV